MATMYPFIISEDPGYLGGQTVRLLEVPIDLQENKHALFAWYAKELKLPEYFGKNWDSLEECLLDLSWLSERRLVIFHRVLPLGLNLKDQQTYICILARVMQDWKVDEIHEVTVIFDPACEHSLCSLAKEAGCAE